ncbi:hypothetical protein ZOSMA_55G00070 [Zostera marina]|uniref:Uncharacterized protein n=1 Tax=Zostera marina TaxID=29655 RepID=A0A0K9NWD7_ZOSMR|nr:hypothetical protein ZOSMA_55G00070 [Zostera marina]
MDHHTATTLSSSAERCSSCESGWTDYLISPGQSTDEMQMVDYTNSYGSGEGYGNTNNMRITKYQQQTDDNDSLMSDASSGPSQHHRKRAHGKNVRNMKGEKEKIRGSSGSSYKIEFNTTAVRKERSVGSKAGSQWKSANNDAASYPM